MGRIRTLKVIKIKERVYNSSQSSVTCPNLGLLSHTTSSQTSSRVNAVQLVGDTERLELKRIDIGPGWRTTLKEHN